MIVREATANDWPQVADLFLATPLNSGTSFVLDRRPDFGALPSLRGRFRTFVALEGPRLAGTVTALWRRAQEGARVCVVGEVIDLRVASWARGGRTALYLLRSAHEVLAAERAEWVLGLIGKHNHAAIAITARKAGLPRLVALEDFASVHVLAVRTPMSATRPIVREAEPADAPLLAEFWKSQRAIERFAPPDTFPGVDAMKSHRAWLAFEGDGTPCGVLVAWDGEALRRLRIVRYRAADLPMRLAIGVTAALGLSARLPVPGEVLHLWATRLIAVRSGGAHTLHALVGAALGAAAAAGRHVLQLNLRGSDPLLRCLPPYPRSTFWTTLYGGPMYERSASEPAASAGHYHADIALA